MGVLQIFLDGHQPFDVCVEDNDTVQLLNVTDSHWRLQRFLKDDSHAIKLLAQPRVFLGNSGIVRLLVEFLKGMRDVHLRQDGDDQAKGGKSWTSDTEKRAESVSKRRRCRIGQLRYQCKPEKKPASRGATEGRKGEGVIDRVAGSVAFANGDSPGVIGCET